MKIFIDANILFTAAYSPQGKAALLIQKLGPLMFTSDYAAEEARRNIQAKKPDAIITFEKLLKLIKCVSTSSSHECPIVLREKDRPFFLTALAEGATHLLTGDLKDFGVFMNKPTKACGILIQTVNDFLNSLD
jgi:predicted nucleic acid-binding protein